MHSKRCWWSGLFWAGGFRIWAGRRGGGRRQGGTNNNCHWSKHSGMSRGLGIFSRLRGGEDALSWATGGPGFGVEGGCMVDLRGVSELNVLLAVHIQKATSDSRVCPLKAGPWGFNFIKICISLICLIC